MSDFSLWAKATHEASHAVCSWLNGAEIVGVRVNPGHGPCDMEATLPPMELERRALIECMGDLAGEVGQWEFGESAMDFHRQDDWRQFHQHVKQAYLLSDWPDAEVAELALRPLVKDLLKRNDRLVYALANHAMQVRHCYGEDCMAILGQQRRMFGITPSLLMAKDWREAFRQALEDQAARMEKSIRAQETKALKW